jgi:cytidylate kinase
MARKQIITIAGRPGSGKSTTAKQVAERLGFRHFSSGDLFRTLGKERGVDVLHANMTSGVTEELDELVDGKLRVIGRTEDRIVIDSRTAWHWIPASYKVFLQLDLDSAARRILLEKSDSRTVSEHISEDAKEYAKALGRRLNVETKRYKKIYDIDPYDMSNYDLVIDTSKNDIHKTVDQVLEGFAKWLNG